MFHASMEGGGSCFSDGGGASFLSEGGAPWGASILRGGFQKIIRWEGAPPLWETLIPGGNFGT